MKIGFDAKWFFSGNPSGRVVVRNILAHLLTKHPEHDFYIFLKRSEKHIHFPYVGSNIHLVYVWGNMSLISNTLAIPLQSLFLHIDVCLFQFSGPPVSFFKRVLYIYDAIFEDHPELFSLRERIYYSPLKFLAKRAHRICTLSESEKTRMVKHEYGHKSKIDVVYCGVAGKYKERSLHDPALLDKARKKYKLPDRFLLYVGRLNQRKNLNNLLKAIPLLQDKKIMLVLGGSYQWKMFDLPSVIASLGIMDRVLLTGFILDDLLAPVLSLAELFCYVSYDEGFGMPPVEAMASGVPVVVANTGSLPEICADAGNYVDPHRPESIAKMVDDLLLNKNLYKEKRLTGIARAKCFTWERSAETLLNSIKTSFYRQSSSQ